MDKLIYLNQEYNLNNSSPYYSSHPHVYTYDPYQKDFSTLLKDKSLVPIHFLLCQIIILSI